MTSALCSNCDGCDRPEEGATGPNVPELQISEDHLLVACVDEGSGLASEHDRTLPGHASSRVARFAAKESRMMLRDKAPGSI
jgi:hypothetical protein